MLPATIRKHIIKNTDQQFVTYTGNWQNDTLSLRSSDEKGASLPVKFTGTQISWYGLARPGGGYARVQLSNSKGKAVLNAIVDMYCNILFQHLCL